MAVILGTGTPLTPLTREVFGEDGNRVLHGAIEAFSRGGDDLDGMCLQVGREFFIHPTLLDRAAPRSANTICWVQITFSIGKLRMQARQQWDKAPAPDAVICEAEPAMLARTAVDTILDFAAAIAQQRLCGGGAECDEQRGLDVQRSVWFMPIDGDQPGTVLCGRCFDRALARDSRLSERVMLDGRRIPFHSPVPIWA